MIKTDDTIGPIWPLEQPKHGLQQAYFGLYLFQSLFQWCCYDIIKIFWLDGKMLRVKNSKIVYFTATWSVSPLWTHKPVGLPSVWALLSLLYLKSTRFDTSVTSSSSSAPFLAAVLSSVDWGVLIFSPLRPWLGVWQHRGESSGKSFSQILQQFYYARGERKAQSVLLPGWNWLLVKPV